MSGVFIDTNVLVYAEQRPSRFHVPARACLTRLEGQGVALWISRQVLREYLAVMTRPVPGSPPIPALTTADAIAAVIQLEATFAIAEDGPGTTEALIGLLRRHRIAGRGIHDANIVATMLAHGLDRLLTFNAADFRRYAGDIALEATEISGPA